MASMSGFNEKVPLMTQGQWMKGCPEGSEQSFLFSLCQELSEGECRCPHGCGATFKRKKSDFYALFVSSPNHETAHHSDMAAAKLPRIHQAPRDHCTPDM